MEVKDFLEKLSTAGDVAAVAIGYAAGFVADTYYFSGGLPPGTVAAVSAVGVVGVKKAFDAILNSWRARGKYEGDSASLEQRADALLRYMERVMDRGIAGSEHPLQKTHDDLANELFGWKSGLMDNSEFNEYVLYAVKECKDYQKLHLTLRAKLLQGKE